MKTETDRITIAIPVFERTEFFRATLGFALGQSVKCPVIVVDNASSHDFFEVESQGQRVSYFRNPTNIGMFPNWNRCFELATTEFVLVLGDDDHLESNYVESFIAALEAHPGIDVFFANFMMFDYATNSCSNHFHTLPFGYWRDGLGVIDFGIKHRLGFPLITSAIRKSAFSGYYSEFHASNDWEWLYRSAERLSFYGDERVLLKYGQHRRNDSSNVITHQRCMLSIWYIYKQILDAYAIRDRQNKTLNSRNIRYHSLYFLSNLDSSLRRELFRGGDQYSRFFRSEFEMSFRMRAYCMVPAWLRRLFFKIVRRSRLVR